MRKGRVKIICKFQNLHQRRGNAKRCQSYEKDVGASSWRYEGKVVAQSSTVEFKASASWSDIGGDDRSRFDILLATRCNLDWAIRLEYKVGSLTSTGIDFVNGVRNCCQFNIQNERSVKLSTYLIRNIQDRPDVHHIALW